ncbi:MAG: TonB-dependent receptor [Bacteroidota bacterium]
MLRRILFLLIIIFTISAQAFAQTGVINGRVTDSKTREPLPGVNVFASQNKGVTTDTNGWYSILLTPGEHALNFSFIGYKTDVQKVKIKVSELKNLNVSLESESTELDGVVVSAGKFEQKLSEVSVSMAVIKPSFLQNNNITSLDAAINKLPGVIILEDQPSIRGGSGFSYGSGSRVLLLVDDLPLLSADMGDIKWDYLPVENIEQVEVIKGATSALFGSSALNGVINIRTAFPSAVPETKITSFSGLYMNPKRDSLRWFGQKQPSFSGISVFHSRMIKNLDVVFGANVYNEDSYREKEYAERYRGNVNLRYRDKKVKGLSYGVNFNSMYQKKSDFFLWKSADSAYSQMPNTSEPLRGVRMNVDPYVVYFTPKGYRHTLRTRFFRHTNLFDDTTKNNKANLFYGEYQFQRIIIGNMTMTAGITGMYSEANANIFGDHFCSSTAIFGQFDKKVKKWNFSLGIRGDYFRLDSTESVSDLQTKIFGTNIDLFFKPTVRAGVTYQLAKFTHLRTSYGQGYRFPSIAEKYTATSVGGLKIFPNPQLEPETGWSAELGVRQGLRISQWSGYLDIAGFLTEYTNMMEFNFGIYIPDSLHITNPNIFQIMEYSGFKSVNVGKARISGIDVMITGKGKFFGLPATLLAGYTYTNPINLSGDGIDTTGTSETNILKYRFYHSAKADFEVTWKHFIFGLSGIYYSNMVSIDKALQDPIIPLNPALPDSILDKYRILPGLKNYRAKHNKGHVIFDARLSYQLNDVVRCSVILKNVFNKEYMGRPGDVGAPRNITLQLVADI